MDFNRVLIEAARDGNIVALKTALEKGADIDTVDSLGMTALMYADKNGHKQIADYLREKGAKEDEKFKTIIDYTKAIELDPSDATAYYNRGNAYDSLDQYQEAINDYTKAIDLDLKYAAAYYNRGTVYYNLDQHQEAINDFTRFIELNPKSAIVYYNRGNAYHRLGQYQEAINDYTKAIDLNPEKADVYNHRGNFYYNLDQYQEAINDYTKAIDDYYQAGVLFLERKDKDRAQSIIGGIKRIDPHSSLITELQDLIDQI